MKSMHLPLKVLSLLPTMLLLIEGGLSQGVAQTRYSVNVVGYSDADFVAGSNLVANPLNAGNNTLSNLFAGVPSGSFFVPWDSLTKAFGPPNQFSSQAGWTDSAATLSRPQGGFLWLPAPRRITFVGEPWPATCVTFPMGETVAGFMPRLSCDWCAGFNDCLIQMPDHMIVEKWDRQGQYFRVYDFLGSEIGWYPDIVEPTLAPDEAAIFRSPDQFRAKSPGSYGPLPPVQLFNPSRAGANFKFQFYSKDGVDYSVQRASSLGSGSWRTVLTERSSPTAGVVSVSVPAGTEDIAFYRVDALRLLHPSRVGSEFQFQFYAEEGIHYRVSRSSALPATSWNPVLNIDGTGALVTATDPAATSPAAYYRVEY